MHTNFVQMVRIRMEGLSICLNILGMIKTAKHQNVKGFSFLKKDFKTGFRNPRQKMDLNQIQNPAPKKGF